MNHLHLIGRLGRDPEIIEYEKTDESGAARSARLAKLSLAVERAWRPNHTHERPDWIPVTAFDGPQARFIQKACKKGDLVSITGRLQRRNRETQDGKSASALEVVIVEINRLSGVSKRAPAEAELAEEAV